MRIPDEADALARRQWGLISRSQALGMMTKHQLQLHLDNQRFLPVHPGVYRLTGSPRTWRQRAMAATLAYGAPVALSHRAAARVWGLESIAAPDPEVTVASGRSGRRAGILTHRAPLPARQMSERFNIPVTSAARTLIDLAGLVPDEALERAIDQAHRDRLTTPAELAELRAASGRKGSAGFREMLDFRQEHPGVGDSEWADRAWRWIVNAGLGTPIRQFRVEVNGHIYILDMAFVAEKIALEYLGFAWHGQRHRFDADARRISELQLAGWLVLPVTSRQERAELLARVRAALEMRRAAAIAGLSAGTAAPR